MRRRTMLASVSATPAIFGLAHGARAASGKRFTIALVPGLTTDAFYITMHRGAQAAAEALGVDLVFQGAPGVQPCLAGAGA